MPVAPRKPVRPPAKKAMRPMGQKVVAAARKGHGLHPLGRDNGYMDDSQIPNYPKPKSTKDTAKPLYDTFIAQRKKAGTKGY